VTDPSRPERRRSPIAINALILVIGVGLGVLLDRHLLRPDRNFVRDARLIGRWIEDEDKTPLEFKTDGTYDYVRVTKLTFPGFGGAEPKTDRLEDRLTGQYRWVDGETVEAMEPDIPFWIPMRFVIEGDRLTLLLNEGKVRRYTRAR
jgi:hypothetical protein